jgi:hypothetical protein
MDPSRSKRKSRTSLRGKSSWPVQKPDDSSQQAAREKAAPSSLDSKLQGGGIHVTFFMSAPASVTVLLVKTIE